MTSLIKAMLWYLRVISFLIRTRVEVKVAKLALPILNLAIKSANVSAVLSGLGLLCTPFYF